jgi:hypothetical protein
MLPRDDREVAGRKAIKHSQTSRDILIERIRRYGPLVQISLE